MQHVEFFHRDHFEYRYHRRKVKKALSHFIDFFWETDFDPLWQHYPQGFSDALFPNIGYTYMINLGTPFVMQLENNKHEVRSDTFLPRHKIMICHHMFGNRIFGIKFKVSPIIFEKKVNFSEYKEHLYPLAYLIDRTIIERIKTADSFEKRVDIISTYYNRIIEKYSGSMKQAEVVTQILKEHSDTNNFSVSIEELSHNYGISSRTLQRYFEATTSISSKQALQILRIRKALEHITNDNDSFHYSLYGYYDYSHFYKHLKGFISKHTIDLLQPHLHLLKGSTAI
ncbi:MAG: AraC family transcriptional regulator [Flaviaesturariibacter sp.]|nr:AraC family transcriptional regulator [Flaviaesturariibacter sp.]